MTAPRLDLLSSLLLLLLGAVWGASFFLAEIALKELPPLTITLHRVTWAVPILAVIVALKRIPFPRSPSIWAAYLVMGALNNAIPFSLIFWGQTEIDSGLASILNGMTAIFGAVAAGLLLKDEPLTSGKVIGAVFGVIGVCVIVGRDALAAFSPANLGQLAVLGAGVSYALASVWGKLNLSSQPPLMNALGMLIGSSVLMVPLVWYSDGPPSFSFTHPTLLALLCLAVLSTSLAYILYFAILARAGAANLMLVTLLVPPFAIGLGVVVLGEAMTLANWVGFGFIALGLLVVDGRLFANFHQKP